MLYHRFLYMFYTHSSSTISCSCSITSHRFLHHLLLILYPQSPLPQYRLTSFFLMIFLLFGVFLQANSRVLARNPIYRVTPVGQASVSSFARNRIPAGVGHLPLLCRFQQSVYPGVYEMLVPTAGDITAAPPLRLYGEKVGFSPWQDTEAGGISSQIVREMTKKFGHFPLKPNNQKHLGSRGMRVGVVTPNSYEDFSAKSRGFYTTVLEAKYISALTLLLQGFVTSTNIIVALLKAGVAVEECAVPVMSTNGFSALFGVTVLLRPSFPVFVPLSKQLDLQDPVERQIVSAFIVKLAQHSTHLGQLASHSSSKTNSSSVSVATNADEPCLCLDTRCYHIKTINHEVFDRGLGLFIDGGNQLEVHSGLVHMIEALNRIYACEATRNIAEYPLAVRTPDTEGGCDCYEFIYRDLSALGFITGAPNRVTEGEVYNIYRDSLLAAVTAIGQAGVIHGDLFISNVLYKLLRGDSGQVVSVEIKLVDWDAAHCLSFHRRWQIASRNFSVGIPLST
jgi:hypothetical protein